MANDVFANGREISCKAADGKSIAAFPDICFTPPQTPATPPGVPIPYPNTAISKDTSKGSKTVKISGKEVMLKNKSCFKKSTGDEAGCAPKKGIATSVNRGKAYFTSWSFNVKFEKKNVVRHMDLMTHNHGSQPGNTPPWNYADTQVKTKNCKDKNKKVGEKCEPSKKDQDEFKKAQEKRNKRLKKKKKIKRNSPIRPMSWQDKHCTGIMRVKPYTDLEGTKKALTDTMEGALDAIDELEDLIIDKGLDILGDKAKKVGVRAGAKYAGSLFGGPIAPILGIISTAVTVVDGAYSTVTGAMEAYDVYKEIHKEIDAIKDVMSKANDQLKRVNEGIDLLKKKDNGTLTEGEAHRLEKLQSEAAKKGREAAEFQAAEAMRNPCLRGLKCTLTPYEHKEDPTTFGKNAKQKGCCPGQTGHHIPPKAYFKDCEKKGYDQKKALVVCAEGVDQRSGSHGRLHDFQDQFVKDKMNNGNLSYDDAITASVDAHQSVFPQCDPKCIREQLETSLDKCKNTKINAITKENGQFPSEPPPVLGGN